LTRRVKRVYSDMLIAIDIGNSNVHTGLFDGTSLLNHFRVSTRHQMTADEAGFFLTGWLERVDIDRGSIDRIVMSSVVPPLTWPFEQASKEYLKQRPTIVSHLSHLPISIDIEQPQQLGSDRIANASAAFVKFGGPVIVVDFGTTTNLDVVSDDGVYKGGVLLPGPETSMSELARRAARLFEVRIEQPDSVVGRSTAEALKSGLFYGTIGQVDFVLDKILEETGFESARIVATGGFASGIEKHSRHISKVAPVLTLEGLRLIGEQNG